MMRPTRGAHPAVLREQGFEVGAADVLHDDARPERVVQTGVVERDGPGVLEPGHEERFALEAVAELGVGRDRLVHHLDDHIPTEVELAREVHLAHSPFSEEAPGLVPSEEYAADHYMRSQGVRSPDGVPHNPRAKNRYKPTRLPKRQSRELR